MNVNLPNDVDQFVKKLVLAGRFASEEAVIAESLRLLMTREQLRTEIAKGIKQLDNGDWIDGDAVFEELHAAIDAIEAEKQGS